MDLDRRIATRRAPRQPTIYAHRKPEPGTHPDTYPQALGHLISGCPVMPDVLMRSGDARLAIRPPDPLRGDPYDIDWDTLTAAEITGDDMPTHPRKPTRAEMLEADTDA